MRLAHVALFGVLVAGDVRPARAQGSVAAAECCVELRFTIGARALGLGEAVTARTAPGSLFVNPALVAGLDADQFIVHNANTSIENSNTFSLLIRSDLLGTFGVSYRLLDYGEQPSTDPNGIQTGTLSTLAHVLTATYATNVTPGLNAGVSYKLFQFRNDCRGYCQGQNFVATTHGLDLGVQLRPPSLPGLEVGASAVHVGFPLQVVNAAQASPMPARLRFGGAYEVGRHLRSDTTWTWWLSGDAVVSPRHGTVELHVGSEVTLDETIYLRAGYSGGEGFASGAAVGVGLSYDRFEIGLAKSFQRSPVDETDPVQITFGIRF